MINFKIKYHNVDVSKITDEINKSETFFSEISEMFSDLALFNIIYNKKDIEEIEEIRDKFFKNKNQFIILGTGGSNLGAKALINIAYGTERKKIKFFDNIDPIQFQNSINQLSFEKVGIIIISKSGNTPETLSQFSAIINIFKSKKNCESLLEDCLIITENKNSPLKLIAEKYNCKILFHHDDIVGRYSVFSNVGLIPAAIAGLDITKIRIGASNLISKIIDGSFKEHLTSAQLFINLQNIKNINLNVLMTYSDALFYFGKWYLQLWAESIGKNTKGITPIHSVGTTDQHSQLQLYLDGPRDKFFTLISKNHRGLGLKMDKTILKEVNVDYLAGKSMGDLMQAEHQATLNTFISKDFPVREINCENIDEITIGQLMAFSIVETVTTCFLLGVNPFNQPAVEKGKQLTKDYLLNY